ncbi:MAG: nucleotidyltransferase family protein, partial [bacterium]
MKIIGIIAEFNPFHNGHARLLSFAKNELSADYVIAVMSGDFVQRGEPACQSRHARAKQALCAGFDAVLSLPVGISAASA